MRLLKIALLIALFALAACAPDNLDITPTVTPTNTPLPTATREPTPTVDPEATPAVEGEAEATAEASAQTGNGSLLDLLVAAVPAQLNAGAIQWNRSADEVTGEELVYQDVDGGRTARIFFDERGGGAAELTFGVFDSPEAATAYYETVRGRLRTLENAQTRDNFPQPNAFGGGTYGSDAVFAQDNLFIRISVPRFSSTAGDPLVPFSRTVFEIVNEVTGASEG
jgi:hypothetical protein